MKKRVILATSGALIAGLIAALAWLYFTAERASAPQATSTTEKTTSAPAEQAITVDLPGASAVPARLEDYTDPSSLWVVVSKDHPLKTASYRPSDLTLMAAVSRTDKSDDERSLRAVVVDDFTSMLNAAKTAGYDLMIGSGFRSYDLQATYYSHYVAVSGEEAANKYSAKPGQSEHQTGLVADVTLRSMECYLDTCFGETAAGKWVAEHAADYGFIVRYPADKTEITKYQYEPWHLRYVGKPLAQALQQSSLTLDEAYPYLQTVRTKLISAGKISAS